MRSSARVIIAACLFVIPAMAGCFGDARSEWAYTAVGLDVVNGDGRNGAGIRIGVLDTGINVEHPSLDHLVDGDRSNGELMGFRDFIRDQDGVGAAYDDQGHGTHVVGIMAARGSSFGDKLLYGGIDLQGGSRDSLYYVAKVCDNEGCPGQNLVDALEWLRQSRVDVVSLSLGGERTNPIIISDAVRNEINALIDSGTVIVASAGNDGPDNSDVNAPGDLVGVISVGAIEEGNRVWSGSNRGDNSGFQNCGALIPAPLSRCDPHKKPEVVAPGVDILSPWLDDGYARATGTSQAAPFVTSIIALMLESNPPRPVDREDVYCLKEALTQNTRLIPGQDTPHDDAAGYGLVDASAAVRAYRSC